MQLDPFLLYLDILPATRPSSGVVHHHHTIINIIHEKLFYPYWSEKQKLTQTWSGFNIRSLSLIGPITHIKPVCMHFLCNRTAVNLFRREKKNSDKYRPFGSNEIRHVLHKTLQAFQGRQLFASQVPCYESTKGTQGSYTLDLSIVAKDF